MSISDVERHTADRIVHEEYREVGFNFRMSDLHAALGLAQLDRLDALLDRRRALARAYDRALSSIDEVTAPFVPGDAEPNYQSYIVRLREGGRAARDALLDAMLRRGVSTRRGLMAVHLEASYPDPKLAGSLEHSEAADAETFILPLSPDLSDADQARVVDALRESLHEVLRG
jgi:dTDP-4-amino-4,6-dideoxygalactose transaminase